MGAFLEIRQLRQFIAVAEEESFTRAAQRCHIVQSALSTSVRQLEDELGARLFVRTTRQVKLTAVGHTFLETARQALHTLESGAARVADVAALRKGRLSIGTVQSLPPFIDLPALLARFHAEYPNIEVKLAQGGAQTLIQKVIDRQLDLAILPQEEASAELVNQIIACDELMLVCAANHPLAAKKSVSLKQLANEAFVDFEPGQGTRRVVDRVFATAAISRRINFEVSDLDTLMGLVEHGLGVALVPRDVVMGRADELCCISLKGVEACWELVVTHVMVPGTDAQPVDAAPAAFLASLMAEVASDES